MIKKNFIILFILCMCELIIAQGSINSTSTDNHLPQVIPPSPTVAALMKFEEIQVSNYNGIPDISIPIFEDSHSDLNISVSLKYHPLSVKKNDIAGNSGLGWSLFAGGSISRTIRGGYPDEFYEPTTQKKGIHHNPYYDVIESFNHADPNYLNSESINSFIFEALEKQKFDTEHDLYQYNFMGYSGRFTIEKQNGVLVVKKLTVDNLRIEYDSQVNKFMILDENGFKYTFDVKELSNNFSFSTNVLIDGYTSSSGEKQFNNYVSAYHLSKIELQDELIAELIYNQSSSYIEKNTRNNSIKNTPVLASDNIPVTIGNYLNLHQVLLCGDYIPRNLLPVQVFTSSTTETIPKLLTQIKIQGKSKVDFTYEAGQRQDFNIQLKHQAPYLKKISILNWNNVEIKNFSLSYDFTHKLFLQDVVLNNTNTPVSKYSLKYYKNQHSPSDYYEDSWGYYGLMQGSTCQNPNIPIQEKTSSYKDVLVQMIYPTKGSVVFKYENNTYSYVGSEDISSAALTGNPDNSITTHISNAVLNSSNGQEQFYSLGVMSLNRTYVIQGLIANNSGLAGFLTLYKYQFDTLVSTTPLNSECYQIYPFEAGFYYKIGFKWNHLAQVGDNTVPNLPTIGEAYLDIYERTHTLQPKKWFNGGGFRIKDIYYYSNHFIITDPEIESGFYPVHFQKNRSYVYNDPADPLKSSGSLVNPVPIYKYQVKRKFKEFETPCTLDPDLRFVTYDVETKINNYASIITKGSEVGYKYVTVTEEGNGETLYTYTNPMDYPEQLTSLAVTYPFVPTENIDYKRGLLISEKKYNEANLLLRSQENSYDFLESSKIGGIQFFYYNYDCPYATTYASYSHFLTMMQNPSCHDTSCSNIRYCGIPTSYIGFYKKKDAFGLARLANSDSKEYFYNNNMLTKVTEWSQNYVYSPSNNKIRRIKTVYPDNSASETTYSYAHDKNNQKLILANMISTPLEVTVRKKADSLDTGKLISRVLTNYPDQNNYPTAQAGNSLVPLSVQTYDLQNSSLPITAITYDLYDDKGNIIQYTAKNGIPTAIMWGYSQTQPIAKIEGATYAQVHQLAAGIIAASNADVGALPNNDETALLNLLDAFRKDPALSIFHITTYTYDPLIGVRSITPPSGIREIYIYDAANRLKEIREGTQNGNILKEYRYNYKQ